jgi:hypothetical protein
MGVSWERDAERSLKMLDEAQGGSKRFGNLLEVLY